MAETVEEKIDRLEKSEETVIKKEKETRGRKPKAKSASKKGDFTTEETALKLYTLFNLPYIIFKKPQMYQQKDFKVEADALNRIAEKYDIVATVLKMFDPITIISNIAIKIKTNSDLRKEPKKI